MPVRWIIADVDGCLAPEASVAWDLEPFVELARQVRRAADGRGPMPPMTLCTGRPQPYAEVLMKLLDVRAPAICENGAIIYTLHDNRARYGPGVTEEKLLGLREVRRFIETQVLPAHPETVLQFGKEAQLSVFSEQPALLQRIKSLVEDFAARRGGPELVVNTSHFYLNISLAGVDKGAALEMLLAQLGVTADHVAGIGDTVGDLPLREHVGFFACPSNAQPEIREVADYVSPRPDVRGILDIIHHPRIRRNGSI